MTKKRLTRKNKRKGEPKQENSDRSSSNSPERDTKDVTKKTSKRKQVPEEGQSGNSEGATIRPVKKIRLVVTRKEEDNTEEVKETPVADKEKPPTSEQSPRRNTKRKQSDDDIKEGVQSQPEVKKLKVTTSAPSSDSDKALKHNDQDSDNKENAETFTTNPVSNTDDILEFFASPTPTEFTSPPEPLFPELGFQLSPSSANLIDALLKYPDTDNNNAQTVTADLSSTQTAQQEVVNVETDSSSRTGHQDIAASTANPPSETEKDESDSENKKKTAQSSDAKEKQVNRKSKVLHDNEDSASSATQAEPVQERKIKKLKVAAQGSSAKASSSGSSFSQSSTSESSTKASTSEPSYYEAPSSKPSSFKLVLPKSSSSGPTLSEPITPSTADNSQSVLATYSTSTHSVSTIDQSYIYDSPESSTAGSRKGKERATPINYDYEPYKPKLVQYDEAAYEDFLLKQEVHSQSQSDEQSFLTAQESLLAYYKSRAKSDSASEPSSSSEGSSEESNSPKRGENIGTTERASSSSSEPFIPDVATSSRSVSPHQSNPSISGLIIPSSETSVAMNKLCDSFKTNPPYEKPYLTLDKATTSKASSSKSTSSEATGSSSRSATTLLSRVSTSRPPLNLESTTSSSSDIVVSEIPPTKSPRALSDFSSLSSRIRPSETILSRSNSASPTRVSTSSPSATPGTATSSSSETAVSETPPIKPPTQAKISSPIPKDTSTEASVSLENTVSTSQPSTSSAPTSSYKTTSSTKASSTNVASSGTTSSATISSVPSISTSRISPESSSTSKTTSSSEKKPSQDTAKASSSSTTTAANNQELPPLPAFKNLARRRSTPDNQRSYITEFISITNNDIQPVSIASTNSDIINRNEVPIPEPFIVQELKSPPASRVPSTTTTSTSTTIPGQNTSRPSITSSSIASRVAPPPRKQFGPSKKQEEINARKRQQQNRGRGNNRPGYGQKRLPSTAPNSSNIENAPPPAASSSNPQSNPPPAAGSNNPPPNQRNRSGARPKILTIDDLLKNARNR